MSNSQVSEAQLSELQEANDKNRRLTSELSEARDQIDALSAQTADLREALDSARDSARRSAAEAILAESDAEFTSLERKALLADLPVVAESHELDADTFRKSVDEAAQESARRSGAGAVRGLGQGSTTEAVETANADVDQYIREAFRRLDSEEN